MKLQPVECETPRRACVRVRCSIRRLHRLVWRSRWQLLEVWLPHDDLEALQWQCWTGPVTGISTPKGGMVRTRDGAALSELVGVARIRGELQLVNADGVAQFNGEVYLWHGKSHCIWDTHDEVNRQVLELMEGNFEAIKAEVRKTLPNWPDEPASSFAPFLQPLVGSLNAALSPPGRPAS